MAAIIAGAGYDGIQAATWQVTAVFSPRIYSKSMADPKDERRLAKLEEDTAWLRERVWTGTGNLHDRVHKLEDLHIAAEIEMSSIKENHAEVKRVLGIGVYGDKNIISDLRDALDTIEKLKGGIISVKDFQQLLNDVNTLKQRGQAQITFWNFVQFAVIGALINLVIDLLSSGVIP